jgi:hypothetical protein
MIGTHLNEVNSLHMDFLLKLNSLIMRFFFILQNQQFAHFQNVKSERDFLPLVPRYLFKTLFIQNLYFILNVHGQFFTD